MRKPLEISWRHCWLFQNEVFVEGINKKGAIFFIMVFIMVAWTNR